jgi:ribose transport system permease protein
VRPARSPELRTALLVFVATVLLILVSRALNHSFGSFSQLGVILSTSVFLVIVAFGQGLTMLLGGIDLSVGILIAVSGLFVTSATNGVNGPLWWAVPAALLLTTLVGAINGLGIARLRIPPFIMTLAVSTMVFGAALGLTSGRPQGTVAPALQTLATGKVAGLPYPVVIIVVFSVLASTLQGRTVFGRRVYALGSNPVAARLSGLRVTALTVGVYALSGLCAGLAGLLLAGYSGSATLDMGNSYLLPSIAAVVVGGASVAGGRGLYLGTLAGAILLNTLDTSISALGLSQGWRSILQGLVIAVALLAQSPWAPWKRARKGVMPRSRTV